MADTVDLKNDEQIFLLLLYADGGSAVPGNLWLQKEVFLIANHLEPLKEHLEYEPHIQGPYSETVKDLLENLQFRGYVRKRKSTGEIYLTEKGSQAASEIYQAADEDLTELVQDMKRFMNDLSKDELLVYIYYTYPGMTTESLEKEDLKHERKEIARQLYEKDKISIGKAAELAGTSVSEFEREVRV